MYNSIRLALVGSLLLVGLQSIANTEQTYGNWKVDSFQLNGYPFTYANTTNNSDSTLGVLCMENSDNCTPYLINQLSCEEDGTYPALVSIDQGITAITMTCLIVGEMFLFLLPDHHLNLMLSNNSYSVAFGTSSGEFKAAYFSLNGSAKAVLAARKLINAIDELIQDKKVHTKYKDTTL